MRESRIGKNQKILILEALGRGLSIHQAADMAELPREVLYRHMRRAQDESASKLKVAFGRSCWKSIAEFQQKAVDMAVGREKPSARTLRYLFAHIATMHETGGWELPPAHEETVRKWSAYVELQEVTEDARLET